MFVRVHAWWVFFFVAVSNFGALQETLGYTFRDESLLRLALTHPSVGHETAISTPHNQRLEFLGDSVLGLILTHELYQRFPELGEGPLTKGRAQLVNRRALADEARRLKLGEYLIVSRGEETSGGRSRQSALADAFEALIGAVYLDAGYEVARDLVLRRFGEAFDGLNRAAHIDNPKGELQELLQADSTEAPRYEMTATSGPDHDRQFECAVFHQGHELGRGHGKSKKEAESQAALAALVKIREQPMTTGAE